MVRSFACLDHCIPPQITILARILLLFCSYTSFVLIFAPSLKDSIAFNKEKQILDDYSLATSLISQFAILVGIPYSTHHSIDYVHWAVLCFYYLDPKSSVSSCWRSRQFSSLAILILLLEKTTPLGKYAAYTCYSSHPPKRGRGSRIETKRSNCFPVSSLSLKYSWMLFSCSSGWRLLKFLSLVCFFSHILAFILPNQIDRIESKRKPSKSNWPVAPVRYFASILQKVPILSWRSSQHSKRTCNWYGLFSFFNGNNCSSWEISSFPRALLLL